MPDTILSGLNPRQREAVEAISGPVLIVAGPGSGKTRVITHRIAYLVDRCGVHPYRIAALTFTNKAAREMKNRLFGTSAEDSSAPLLGWTYKDPPPTISTFHSFCARVLRRHGELLGLDKDYTIYDQSDQTSVVKRAMEELDINVKQFSPGNILSAISGAKSKLIDVEGYRLEKSDYFAEIVHRVYERYEDLLAQSSALDFDDLILKTHALLREHSDVAESYRDRYVHVMVDEFQDTNIAQYEIAKQLAGQYRNLCVVGDPDQSIYSWRNADIRNILSFQRTSTTPSRSRSKRTTAPPKRSSRRPRTSSLPTGNAWNRTSSPTWARASPSPCTRATTRTTRRSSLSTRSRISGAMAVSRPTSPSCTASTRSPAPSRRCACVTTCHTSSWAASGSTSARR